MLRSAGRGCGRVTGGFGGGRKDVLANVGSKDWKDGVVVLEEGAGGVGEDVVVNKFSGDSILVGDTGFLFGIGRWTTVVLFRRRSSTGTG